MKKEKSKIYKSNIREYTLNNLILKMETILQNYKVLLKYHDRNY